MCGNVDDCGLGASRNENCVDEVNGYTCDCDEDFELMLQVSGSVCVAKGGVKMSLEHGSVEPP